MVHEEGCFVVFAYICKVKEFLQKRRKITLFLNIRMKKTIQISSLHDSGRESVPHNFRNVKIAMGVLALSLVSVPCMQAVECGESACSCARFGGVCGVAAKGDTLRLHRPEVRTFRSEAVEKAIRKTKKKLTNPYLRQMFENCYPNTLDTTVKKWGKTADGDDDTFIITGDIPALWLRDASAQVLPYLRFAKEDKDLKQLIRGLIRRCFRSIQIDPYANAFNENPQDMSPEWSKDYTRMLPGVFERKYELDSQCYPLLLACDYMEETGDMTVADKLWLQTVDLILTTMEGQASGKDWRKYKFSRTTHALHDTRSNYGIGHPGKPCGLIASAFRPSDDSNILPFNIPGNFMAAYTLERTAQVLRKTGNGDLAARCETLAAGVRKGIEEWGVVNHPQYGRIYAYEVDGRGSAIFMDDANVPSLLSLPYIANVPADDPIYVRTRRFILSDSNPYFFSGKAGKGIGGPHVGMDYIWPMCLIMQAMTSTDDKEIADCLSTLMKTDAGTMFMHEAFHKDDASSFTRHWFAWTNSLFGQLILQLIDEGKTDLLNSLPEK